MRKKTKRSKYFETFEVKQKTELYERLMWGLESVIYILCSFYAGFEFSRSKNLLWFGLLIFILILRFQWRTVRNVTKKVVL